MFYGLIFVFIPIFTCNAIEQGYFMGCYKDVGPTQINIIEGFRTPKQCVDVCHNKYYRYSFVHKEGGCICSNYLGDQKDPNYCKDYCKGQCDIEHEIADVYYTGIEVNGPPRNLLIENITDTKVHLEWKEPESFVKIDNYKVQAIVLNTYSSTNVLNLSWMYSNNTFSIELISLHPGTHYNITVQAVSSEEDGAAAYMDFATDIGEPSQKPAEPEIKNRQEKTMQIKLKPVLNDNGPISSYLMVVINAEFLQAVQPDNLKAYSQANAEGLSYYIAAEIPPERINEIFTIGDGKIYGRYYNAPLEKDSNYHVMIGVVSKSNGVQKVVYSGTASSQNYIVVLQMNNDANPDSPVLIVILSVAIVIISLLLIAGLIGFYFLRNHVHHRHRQRLNDNQELTIQGPIIDVENNGYIPEDEEVSPNHYQNLHQQVWVIPRNLLTIEHAILLGIGKFGRVYSGSVLKDNSSLPVSVYSIADKKLQPDEKHAMLKDLDILIKSNKFPNVLDLIGTCENLDTVSVVLEYTNANLKDLLLKSRIFTSNQFTNLSKSQALDFAIDIAKGMDYLHSKKIIHKQLCSMHIVVINGNLAKISGFGIAKYYKNESIPNIVRYTAREVFRGQQHITKSDIWSFACVLWEICVLGGTPYGSMSNTDLPDKIIRGLSLPQLPYISDSLYQLMLNCWQIDFDERPTFSELIIDISNLKNEHCLSFNMYEGFQYEPQFLELETTNNPIY